jgi:two-component system LytT family response regulator
VVIRIADVDWVKAEHDYVSLFVGNKSWLVRETIASIERRFANAGFVRIHRSTLVNVDRVRELRPLHKGEFQVILQDGVELKLSRNFRAALTRLAGAPV